MGQLERYGLYVLCMVIVLILGVAIWGGDPVTAKVDPPMDDLDRALTSGSDGGHVAATVPGVIDAGRERPGAGFFDPVPPQVSGPGGIDLGGVTPVDDVTMDRSPASGGEPAKSEAAPQRVDALRTYTVRAGDTMESIAVAVLGSKKYVAQIRKLNPSVNPRLMRPGQTVLKLPWVSGESRKGLDVTADQKRWREYEVRKGDSAYKISQRVYGTPRYADDILKANGIADATKMRPKTVLRIPPLK